MRFPSLFVVVVTSPGLARAAVPSHDGAHHSVDAFNAADAWPFLRVNASLAAGGMGKLLGRPPGGGAGRSYPLVAAVADQYAARGGRRPVLALVLAMVANHGVY